jgi:hypothetical protein
MATRAPVNRKRYGNGGNSDGNGSDDRLANDHRVSVLNKIYYTNHVDTHILRSWMEDKWGHSYDVEFYQQNDRVWTLDVKTTYLGQDDFRFSTCEEYENHLSDICESINDAGLAEQLAYEINRCTHAPYIILGRWKRSVKIPMHLPCPPPL